MIAELDSLTLLGLVALGIHMLGALTAARAVVQTRTAQGATAWAISLVSFPYLALPLYWVFGRDKFHGYVRARRSDDAHLRHLSDELTLNSLRFSSQISEKEPAFRVLEKLARLPFTTKNSAELLIDGQATFDAIFKSIAEAKKYILVQFFIIKNDEIGRELKTRLVQKAKEGVSVRILYDEMGSLALRRTFLREFLEAGITVTAFSSTKGRWNRFQYNFRNHRKTVVVDGHVAFVGGHNVGDEYMGRDPYFGHWRDTHVRVEGPLVKAIQLAFVEDWYWATHEIPSLEWEMLQSGKEDIDALVVPTGPADSTDTCALMFAQAIQSAKKRFWIASPYFVPDSQILVALQLAALRGVDVRIILPEKPDHKIVYLAGFSYLEQMEPYGVKVYRYMAGFMHHKTFLIDDSLAAVGTANLDNRSFRLNFEITLLFANASFTEKVERMFEEDFRHSRRVFSNDLAMKSAFFRLGVRAARLLAPIL